jgi:hypothetical protein
MRPGPIEIDDSRLRDMWARHQQRSLFTARAVRVIGIAAVLGIATVLAAIALAFWALERNPPVVNVQPAEVHVTVPEQKAPVVNIAPPAINVTRPKQEPPVVNVNPNITVPKPDPPVVNVYPQITVSPSPAPAPLLPQVPVPPTYNGPENKVVTEYVIFQEVPIDGFVIRTGWAFHNSSETAPYFQYCYWEIDKNRKIVLAQDRIGMDDLAQQASQMGVTMANTLRYLSSCRWF